MHVHRAVPNLTVADLPTAVAEYKAALGLNVLMDQAGLSHLATTPSISSA